MHHLQASCPLFSDNEPGLSHLLWQEEAQAIAIKLERPFPSLLKEILKVEGGGQVWTVFSRREAR